MFLLPCESDNDLSIMTDLLDMALKTHAYFITDARSIHRRAANDATDDDDDGDGGEGRRASVSFFDLSKGVVDVEKQALEQTSSIEKLRKLEKQLKTEAAANRKNADWEEEEEGLSAAAAAAADAKALMDEAFEREIEVLKEEQRRRSGVLVRPSPP